MQCDFHLHSTKSDGRLTPAQLIDRAKHRGLDYVSLTDHDTVVGVEETVKAGLANNIGVLPGIEISSYAETEVHILAYNLDYQNPSLSADLDEVKSLRKTRNYAIVDKLRGFGICVDLDRLYEQANGKTIGRPDIADDMVRQGICTCRLSAFEEYLGFDKKAYVKSKRLTPKEAIELATRYNGIPVLAHPKNLKLSQHATIDLIKQLIGYGLRGIEADYYAHTELERKFYRSLADKYKLIVTGGSDFHDNQHGGECDFRPNKFTRKVLKLPEDTN
ncbi:MAG: PHP domain-containing protein [Clostridia bacterium]|nr:PHP domain-containing protein [Clostridia bacterium]